MANQVQGLLKNNGDPMSLYKDVMKDKTPEQIEQFYSFARQWGVTDETIEQLQNSGINTK